jgi:hypothetical protein
MRVRAPIEGRFSLCAGSARTSNESSATRSELLSSFTHRVPHMEYSRPIAWLLLNVAVPLLAPIALLPLLGAGKKYRGRVKSLIRRSLQEGQLFWTVIAMCAAAWYEAAVHLGQLQGTAEEVATGSTIAWTTIGWHILIIIISSVLVLLGTMDAADEEGRQPTVHTAEVLGRAPPIMVVSIWMSLATAVSFTATHLWIG